MYFFNFDHLRNYTSKFRPHLRHKFYATSLSFPPLIFSYLKLLSMTSYGGELVLDSSSPGSSVFNHIFSFSISLSLIFKKQKTPLMKKIQGLQAPHGATSSSYDLVNLSLHKLLHAVPIEKDYASIRRSRTCLTHTTNHGVYTTTSFALLESGYTTSY